MVRERIAGQERYRLNIAGSFFLSLSYSMLIFFSGLSEDTLNVLGDMRTKLPHEDFIAMDAMDHDGQNGVWETMPES